MILSSDNVQTHGITPSEAYLRLLTHVQVHRLRPTGRRGVVGSRLPHTFHCLGPSLHFIYITGELSVCLPWLCEVTQPCTSTFVQRGCEMFLVPVFVVDAFAMNIRKKK